MEEKKILYGYNSIDYKGVRYICVKDPTYEIDYESMKKWLSIDSEVMYAVVNKKTFAHMENIAWEERNDE